MDYYPLLADVAKHLVMSVMLVLSVLPKMDYCQFVAQQQVVLPGAQLVQLVWHLQSFVVTQVVNPPPLPFA
jgi:hypothetical protein